MAMDTAPATQDWCRDRPILSPRGDTLQQTPQLAAAACLTPGSKIAMRVFQVGISIWPAGDCAQVGEFMWKMRHCLDIGDGFKSRQVRPDRRVLRIN